MSTSTNVLVTRNQWEAYMKVGATPAYELIGEGFTDFSESKNPKEYNRQYVNQKSETSDVVGYSPSISYSADTYSEDPVIKELALIHDTELIGTSARREVVTVNTWEAGATTGTFKAFQRTYAVIPDSKGGSEALVYSGNLKCVSDVVMGEFNPTTKAFTPDE